MVSHKRLLCGGAAAPILDANWSWAVGEGAVEADLGRMLAYSPSAFLWFVIAVVVRRLYFYIATQNVLTLEDKW